jgi:hypothetical protein
MMKLSECLTHQVELPADVCKCGRSSLEVNQICESNGCYRETDALCPDVIRKELCVEDYTSDIDTNAVEGEEDVKCCNANTKTGFVGSSSRVCPSSAVRRNIYLYVLG